MLDARFVAENPDAVRDHLVRRQSDEKTLGIPARVATLTEKRSALLQAAEAGRAKRNQLSPQIGRMMKEGKREEADALKLEVKAAAEAIKAADDQLGDIESERDSLLMALPNLLHPAVPDGKGEHENVEIRRWGAPPEMDFDPKPHDELAENLGLLDQEQSARISGARFAVLHGSLARLERALINFFVDTHTQDHGYQEVMVPYVVWRTAMEGTGQLPKFEQDAFKLSEPLNGQDAFLIPTAEVPVTNLFRGDLMMAEDLPKALVCFTPCFRSEAGSYGKDTRGLIRQHQFHKVEMVRITTAENAEAAHQELTGHAEAILKALGLHFRTVALCSGDVGFSASLCYDLEVWLPGQQAFREISSCSLFGEFQSRRMKIRYRPDGEKSKPQFCHTINGSGLAVGRTLVAILENYQQADGSVIVPEVLRGYMGNLDRITKLD
jgi:seryl-tRNA synthetase